MTTADQPDRPTARGVQSYYARLVEPFRYTALRVLWASTFSNQLGHGMQQVVLGWLVYDMTGSGGMVGAIFAVRSAPNLIVGLAAGPITDRVDRRVIIGLASWGKTLASLAIALLLFADALTVWALMSFTFFLGTVHAFYMVARQVYVYDVVGPGGAVNGIAAISLAQRLGQIAGALAAGPLIAWAGPQFSFLGMSAGYFLGSVAIFWLRQVGASAPAEREPIAENIMNYVRALKTNRVMLCLMISTAAAEAFGFSHQVILPILAKEVLGIGAVGLSVVTAFRYLGGAVGVIALAMAGQLRRPGLLLLVTLALFGLGEVLLGQSVTFWMAVVFVTFINAMASVTDVLHQSLLQLSVSNEQRGRAMGSWIVGIGVAPVGQLQLGYLAQWTDSRIAMLVNGAALAAVALAMAALLPRLRRL